MSILRNAELLRAVPGIQSVWKVIEVPPEVLPALGHHLQNVTWKTGPEVTAMLLVLLHPDWGCLFSEILGTAVN